KYRKRQQKLPQPLADHSPALDALAAPAEEETAFSSCWRDELLARTWYALAQAQPTYFTVLHFRAGHPDLSSDEMAEKLTVQLGKPMTAAGCRQTLRRARERFADLLLDEVARSVDPPTADRVADELLELNLLEYCRPAL